MTGRVEKYVKTDGSNSWKIVIEMGEDKVTGKRIRKFHTVNGTKKEAEKIMRDMLTEMQSNTYIAQSRKTVKEWVTEWMDAYIYPTYSPNTAKGYEMIVKGHIIPVFGHIKLQELSTLDLQKYYNKLAVSSPCSNRPISPKTIRNINMVIQAALTRAEELDMIKKNPAKLVQLPKCKKYVGAVYDQQEIQILLNASKDTDMEVAIAILLALGLRRGELLALKYSDIDWDNSKVHIARSLARKNNTLIEKAPKTESSDRVIDMPLSLLEILRKSKMEYMKSKLRLGRDFHDNGYIVCRENGLPHDPNNFSVKFKKLIKKTGLKYVRLHDMRHTNATLMLTLGISPKIAQKRLGHSEYSTTMDIYSHVLEEVEQEATNKLEESIFTLSSHSKKVNF